MRRREFVTLFTGAAIFGSCGAVAQTSSKVYRVGTLTPGLPRDEKSPDGVTLVRALADRGYTLGTNLTFDARGAQGQISRLPEILQEMKTANVDVIVTMGYPSAFAARAFAISIASGFFRSRTMAFFACPSTECSSEARPGSPLPGASILMTSAPIAAR